MAARTTAIVRAEDLPNLQTAGCIARVERSLGDKMMSPGADVAQSQDHRIADLSLHAEIEVLRIRQHVVGLEARRARDGLELGPDACGSGAGNRKGEPLTGIVAATAVLVMLLQVHFCRADVEETKGRVAGDEGAAARMGLKRTTLISRMKKLGIDPRRIS